MAQIAWVRDVVKTPKRLTVIAADPTDDRVLEAAVEGKSRRIVRGNCHPLQLRDYEGIRILSAAEFLTEVGSGERL